MAVRGWPTGHHGHAARLCLFINLSLLELGRTDGREWLARFDIAQPGVRMRGFCERGIYGSGWIEWSFDTKQRNEATGESKARGNFSAIVQKG